MIEINTLIGNSIEINTGSDGGSSGHADTWYKYENDTEWRNVSIKGSVEGHFDEGEGVSFPTEQIPNVKNVVAIEIGTDVTSIGEDAFNDCYLSLTSVTIPNSVTNIGKRAFWNCTHLTSLTIGENVTSIGENAFVQCYRLTSVIFEGKTLS